MENYSLKTGKPHKLFCLIFSWRKSYEIINVSDIIISIVFLIWFNFVPVNNFQLIFCMANILFLLISTATFFTYYYYRTFGSKMHYIYFVSALVFCLLTIMVSIVEWNDFLGGYKNPQVQQSIFYLLFLLIMSLYEGYSVFILMKVFFLK